MMNLIPARRAAQRRSRQEGPVVSVELVSPAAVRGFACPYCRRTLPPEEGGTIAAQAAWGTCGAVAVSESRPVGLLLIRAAADAESKAGLARICTAWVAEGFTRQGTGTALVQTVAEALVIARASELQASSAPLHGCAALPPAFLASVGFTPARRAALWRMDLLATVRPHRRSVLDRIEQIVQSVRPVAPPEPARRHAVALR